MVRNGDCKGVRREVRLFLFVLVNSLFSVFGMFLAN